MHLSSPNVVQAGSSLEKALYALKKKAIDLYQRGYIKEGLMAFTCAYEIESIKETPDVLRTKAPKYIQEIRPLLNPHRGCGNILNSLLFLVTGGVLYFAGLAIKAAVRGHWSFALFGSDSGSKLSGVEQAIRSLPSRAPA